MNEQKQRQFINGVWIEQKKFDSGGSILKLSVLPDKFIESLKSATPNDKGYVKLVIARRKELGKNNESHTLYVDDWQPSNSKPTAPTVTRTAPKTVAKTSKPAEDNEF